MKAIVLGAGGFIGTHLVTRLVGEGYEVTGVDIKKPEFSTSDADKFILMDLRSTREVKSLGLGSYDEIYQLAADMGGAGYVFSKKQDFSLMSNSAAININVTATLADEKMAYRTEPKVFFSSSACVYPQENQRSNKSPICVEDSAYPANPDSEYGWEKLFAERLYLSLAAEFELVVKIARFHNIFGPLGTWRGGKEKVPAALCRKIAEVESGSSIEVWGDGFQTRSFLFIEECIEGIRRLMKSDCSGPYNIGSEEMVSINTLVMLIANIAKKKIHLIHVDGPLGVRGRNSDNRLIKKDLGWEPSRPLSYGLRYTYDWVNYMVCKSRSQNV